jgi:hypothetical protein
VIDHILIEAGRLVLEIQGEIFEHPEVTDIWLDHENREIVVVSAEDCLEYAIPVDEFLRMHLPRH